MLWKLTVLNNTQIQKSPGKRGFFVSPEGENQTVIVAIMQEQCFQLVDLFDLE